MKQTRLLIVGAAGLLVAGFSVWGVWSQWFGGNDESVVQVLETQPPQQNTDLFGSTHDVAVEPVVPNNRHRSLTLTQITQFKSQVRQTAALYNLVMASNVKQLQALLEDAAKLTNIDDRNAVFLTVYARLLELNPTLTLSLIDAERRVSNKMLNQAVWRSWGKVNLKQALKYAEKVTDPNERHRIAQVLYGVVGFDTKTQAQVSQALRTEPSARVKAANILKLAQRSVPEAMAQLNGFSPVRQRDALASQLGRVLGEFYGVSALDSTPLITVASTQDTYESGVLAVVASTDAHAFIQRFGNQAKTAVRQGMRVAFNKVASEDIELAIGLWSELGNRQLKLEAASSIVDELGRTDVFRSVTWALAADRQIGGNLLQTSMVAVTQQSPELVYEALIANLTDPKVQKLLPQVLNSLAKKNPDMALAKLPVIKGASARQQAQLNIINQWALTDTDAAFEYYLNHLDGLDNGSIYQLSNLSAALTREQSVRLLQKTSGSHQYGYTDQYIIANVLGDDIEQGLRDLQAAYPGHEFVTDLRKSIIRDLSYDDVDRALTLARQAPNGPERDTHLSELINYQFVFDDPHRAVGLLDEIEDDTLKRKSLATVVSAWATQSADDAKRFALTLNDDIERDIATSSFIGVSKEPINDLLTLAEKINDPDSKAQSYTRLLSRMAVLEPERTQRLLEDIDFLPAEYRRSIDQLIEECHGSAATRSSNVCDYYRRGG